MNFGSVAVSRPTSKTHSTEIDRLALQDLERGDLQSRFMRRRQSGGQTPAKKEGSGTAVVGQFECR